VSHDTPDVKLYHYPGSFWEMLLSGVVSYASAVSNIQEITSLGPRYNDSHISAGSS
jgi:hypothetical protein